MPHAQNPYPGPRRPQIGPALSGSHPTTAAGVLRTDLCPPPPRQSRASTCLLAPHHRRSQAHARLCQHTRRGSFPAPEGDPTPPSETPPRRPRAHKVLPLCPQRFLAPCPPPHPHGNHATKRCPFTLPPAVARGRALAFNATHSSLARENGRLHHGPFTLTVDRRPFSLDCPASHSLPPELPRAYVTGTIPPQAPERTRTLRPSAAPFPPSVNSTTASYFGRGTIHSAPGPRPATIIRALLLPRMIDARRPFAPALPSAPQRYSRLSKDAAGGSGHAVSPALVSPPAPPLPRRPLSKRNTAGGETHPSSCRHFVIGIRRRFAGGATARLLFRFINAALAACTPFASSGRACGCGCPEPLRRFANPPNPP